MALALAPGARAAADAAAGISWIASRQEDNGGFPSGSAESVNSTGLALQALTLRASAYQARIGKARAFLASQQNSNGGFDVDAGQPGSNLRASVQAVSGVAGTSFGTLSIDMSGPPAAQPRTSPARGGSRTVDIAIAVVIVLIAVVLQRRRRPVRTPAEPAEPADRQQGSP
jgi:hypothetical protein